MNLIQCENLTLKYESSLTAAENLNFHVEEQDYLCIVGENGAGKSTLIKALLGFLKPTSGSITFATGLRSTDIGYLPQQTDHQKDFPASCEEIILSGCLNRYGRRLFVRAQERKLALNAMEKLSITDLRHRCYRELSGGQQQRVLLARAMCAAQKILLLDEPASGLDPVVTQELYEQIAKINEEEHITIIMVTHDLEHALHASKHILQLEQKQLFFGTPEEYQASTIGKSFLAAEHGMDHPERR